MKEKIIEHIRITRHRTKWTYKKILGLFEISKSEINRWKKEKYKPEDKRIIKNPCKIIDEEKEIVIAYRKSSDENRNMWYKKLTWKMIDEDVVYLSESSVYRILRENKLLGRVFKENDGAKKEYENKPERIHEHWHTDIAYVVISRIHYYLILIIDGFSRYLLSWELMTDMMALSVELFTLKTLEKYPGVRPKIIHDNGSQYISNDFKNLLLNNNCIDIPTRVRHPETNGKAERMIGLIRQEALRPNSPSYYEGARRTIEEYVDIYNNKRFHSGIKYLKPVDVFCGNDKKILDERQLKLSQAKKKRIQYNTMINRNQMEVYSLNLAVENSRFV